MNNHWGFHDLRLHKQPISMMSIVYLAGKESIDMPECRIDFACSQYEQISMLLSNQILQYNLP